MQAESKSINLKFAGNDAVNGFFDAELISVVIRNLVSNALKFTPHGGSITLDAKHQVKTARKD